MIKKVVGGVGIFLAYVLVMNMLPHGYTFIKRSVIRGNGGSGFKERMGVNERFTVRVQRSRDLFGLVPSYIRGIGDVTPLNYLFLSIYIGIMVVLVLTEVNLH